MHNKYRPQEPGPIVGLAKACAHLMARLLFSRGARGERGEILRKGRFVYSIFLIAERRPGKGRWEEGEAENQSHRSIRDRHNLQPHHR